MRLGRVLASTLSFGLTAAILVAACSDDVSFVECDTGTTDTGKDSRLDSTTDQDTGDTENDAADDTANDTNTSETSVEEAGFDARFDVDAGPDALDKFPDTSVDGAPTFDAGPPDPVAFTDQLTGTYCARVGSCCLALKYQPTFNNAKCVTALNNSQYPTALFGIPTIYKSKLAGGHITFDPVAGKACLVLLETYSCAAFGSADWIELNRQCLAAMKGNIPIGQTGCTDAIECAPPAMCDIPDGGTTGTCRALLQSNTSCTDSSQCGDGLTGVPRFCDNLEKFPIPPSGVCKDQKPVGAECNGSEQECTSQLCEIDETASTEYRCSSQSSFTTPAICTIYK